MDEETNKQLLTDTLETAINFAHENIKLRKDIVIQRCVIIGEALFIIWSVFR